MLAAIGAGLLVSPLLASWSASLAGGVRVGWWRPRRVSGSRWAVVAAVTVVLVLLGTAGHPGAAWWLLAAGGAVLAVVDAQTQLLPARFVYPLAAAVLGSVVIGSVIAGDGSGLLRAAAGTAVIAGVTLTLRFFSPAAVGLGDVRVAALTAGLLGWVGWSTLWQAQVLIVLLGGVTGIVLWLGAPGRGWRFAVPMGPAIILGSLLALWV